MLAGSCALYSQHVNLAPDVHCALSGLGIGQACLCHSV